MRTTKNLITSAEKSINCRVTITSDNCHFDETKNNILQILECFLSLTSSSKIVNSIRTRKTAG